MDMLEDPGLGRASVPPEVALRAFQERLLAECTQQGCDMECADTLEAVGYLCGLDASCHESFFDCGPNMKLIIHLLLHGEPHGLILLDVDTVLHHPFGKRTTPPLRRAVADAKHKGGGRVVLLAVYSATCGWVAWRHAIFLSEIGKELGLKPIHLAPGLAYGWRERDDSDGSGSKVSVHFIQIGWIFDWETAPGFLLIRRQDDAAFKAWESHPVARDQFDAWMDGKKRWTTEPHGNPACGAFGLCKAPQQVFKVADGFKWCKGWAQSFHECAWDFEVTDGAVPDPMMGPLILLDAEDGVLVLEAAQAARLKQLHAEVR